MPELSRRHVLALVPAAGLVAAVRPTDAEAATPDQGRILANTLQIFAGTEQANARPDVAAKVARIDTAAKARLTAMDNAGPGELLAGLPLGTSDPNLTTSYLALYEIALATRTPGSTLEDNAQAQQRVLDGLRWLHAEYFGDQTKGYYGNWFNWEIGIPTHVSKTLVLLQEKAPTDLTTTYIATLDAYLRSGKNGDVDLDSRFHTGANLADITTNRILQGALLQDDQRIAKAVSDQATVFRTVDPYHLQHGVTDGYYADGSFIQHGSVAYTGSYGRGLLTRIVQTIKITDGTTYSAGEDLVDTVRGWVQNGFAPLIFEGWMMEIVKGRAVSRTATGYADVGTIVEAVVDLSEYAPAEAKTKLRGYVKYLRQTSRATLDPASFVSPMSIARYTDILADATTPPADLSPAARSVAFNAMDRTVHRRPGYAFALARSSNRISKYEYMSNENLLSWFHGDGAYYLYLAGQDQAQAFGVNFYTTVDPYRLPGTTTPTEQRKTIPELYGLAWYDNPTHPLNFTSSSESQNKYVYFPQATNAFSGGATLGTYGVAGMVQQDDVPYVDKQQGILPSDFVVYQNARSTKSWFLLDDEIVVLAAGVHDPRGRATTTTLDSRTAVPTDAVAVTGERRDGTAWSGAGVGALSWLRYANGTQQTAAGYVFLDAQQATVRLDSVTRNLRVIRTPNPNTTITKNVFTVAIEKPAAAKPTALAYALVPNATETQLRGYASGGPISVLSNTPLIQAISHSGLGFIAANVFENRVRYADRLAIDGPASVLLRTRTDETTELAVSDPTMHRDAVTVVIRGRPLQLVESSGTVEVKRVAGGTSVRVNTHQAYGKTTTARLG